MSKKSKPKKPSMEKAVERPTSKEVITMLKKVVPTQAEIKSMSEPLKPPTKPAKLVVKPILTPARKPKIQADRIVKTKLKKRVVDLPPEHEKYFVYLKSPLEYRRHLLESSKKILFCLKGYQKILLIRQQKLDEMQRLKASLKELIYLNKKFNEKLPKYNVAFLEDMPNADKDFTPEIRAPKLRKPIDVPQEKTEVDRLEESLANIERKLRDLK